MQRAKYAAMPLAKLRKIRFDLDQLITELEKGPRGEVDIAVEHSDASTVHEILEVDGARESGRWRQLERIYCCEQRCGSCPHGPYWYRYILNKRTGKLKIKYAGRPFFDYETIRWLRSTVREPKDAYVISRVSDAGKT